MFSGKVVLITGASSGIGASTAVHFAREKALLTITGRNKENLEKTAKLCEEANGNKPLMIIGDITKIDLLSKLISTTIETYSKLDILINNAGIVVLGGIEDTASEQLDRIYETNLKSVFNLTKLSIAYLKQTNGNVINISSVAGKRPFPTLLPYAMMKAALDQFTRCLALELGSAGVRVNSVNPGLIDTNIFTTAGVEDEEYSKFLEASKANYPLGKTGTVKDVAKMIMFLASEDAGFVTGETICVDGGKQFALRPL